MFFVDRKKEIKQLDDEYKREGSSFVVVYGRRRVGKTALIKKFISDKDSVYYLATEESDEMNRKHFQETIVHLNPIFNTRDVFSWDTLFTLLPSPQSKRIIVIDEFQYLDEVNHSFLSILQKIWDEKLKSSNVMLIICGSLIRMMWSQTMNISSPLYGRRTCSMRIHPIPFEYYNDFYSGKLTKREMVEMYSVTGGVPKYIEMFSTCHDVYSAIKERVLDTSSILLDEPETILRKEVSSIGTYFSILSAIALGNEKLGDISSYLNTEQTKLTNPLSVLIDLDLIERVIPVTNENPGKCRKGLYKIKDPYFRFWFKFIYPNMSQLNMGWDNYVMDRIRTNLVDSHTAFIYKDISRTKLCSLQEDGALPFSFNRIGAWWDQSTEIDVVAYDSFGLDMCFGECKFRVEKTGRDVLDKLIEKSKKVKWKNEERREWFALFSISGFTDDVVNKAKEMGNLLLFE